MSALVDNHPLARDLPDYKEIIHTLKLDNTRFAKLMAAYEELDKSIVRAEQGVDHLPDLELDKLKMQRVHLKDELYQMLQRQKDK